MKITPLRDQVVLKTHLIDKSEGGLVLPDSQKRIQFEVMATGPGRVLEKCGKLTETELKPGDFVIFGSHPTITKITDKGVTYFVVPESDVAAVIED